MKPSATSRKKKTPAKSVRGIPSKKASRKPAPLLPTIEKLKEAYPDAHCELTHTNAFELLVATILSAQCTDARVNMVTPELFRRFGTPAKMAAAPVEDIEEIIRSTGFFKNKAKNLKACATALVQRHGGQVPQDMDQLTALAGVGRKTANVVLGNAFGISSGVVVDTHVSRISQRLGWSRGGTPEKIEQELNRKVPREDWILISHLLIFHGRRICFARSPHCDACFLFDACPRNGVK